MRVGDTITITNGKYSCEYLGISVFLGNQILFRRKLYPKTKADRNRFAEQITIKIN